MATADGRGETVVVLGSGAPLAATSNCWDGPGAAAETSPSSWGSLRRTWAEEEDASFTEMFDTSPPVSLPSLRALLATTCCYCLCLLQNSNNNNIVLMPITGTRGRPGVELCGAFVPYSSSFCGNEVGHQLDVPGPVCQNLLNQYLKFHSHIPRLPSCLTSTLSMMVDGVRACARVSVRDFRD